MAETYELLLSDCPAQRGYLRMIISRNDRGETPSKTDLLTRYWGPHYHPINNLIHAGLVANVSEKYTSALLATDKGRRENEFWEEHQYDPVHGPRRHY